MGKIIDANTPKGYPVMHKAALGRPQRSVPNGRARRSQIRCTRSARKRSPSTRPVEQRYTASRPAHSILELSRFSGHLPTPVGRSCSYYDRSLFRECLDSFRTRTAGCLAPLPAGPRAGSGELSELWRAWIARGPDAAYLEPFIRCGAPRVSADGPSCPKSSSTTGSSPGACLYANRGAGRLTG